MVVRLNSKIKQKARQLGFDLCRIIPIGEVPHIEFFDTWLAQGYAGNMTYLQRNLEKRRNPGLLASANQRRLRTMIVLGMDYHQPDLPFEMLSDPSRGVIAAYARGEDYHELIRPLLYELDTFIAAQTGRKTPGKCLVDSGPVLERDWAQLAGIGFTGKNCCIVHPRLGSWLLLATILTPERIDTDATQPLENLTLDAGSMIAGLPWDGDYGSWQIPSSESESGEEPGTCGKCSRCLAACPTGALVSPYLLDARKCISYWTIESRDCIPRELRPQFGNRIFGCDVCQTVCPWNQRLKESALGVTSLQARAEQSTLPLLEGFSSGNPYLLEEEAFAARFAKTPLLRAGRSGMLRNVCVALGNWGSIEALAVLVAALEDRHPVVRAMAAWAIGEVARKNRGLRQAFDLLTARLVDETDTHVLEEIQQSLK